MQKQATSLYSDITPERKRFTYVMRWAHLGSLEGMGVQICLDAAAMHSKLHKIQIQHE